MERDSSHTEYIAYLLGSLNDENMSVIDFDQLKTRLGDMAQELQRQSGLSEQLSLLRADYAHRIGGMIKATAAVDRKRDAWQEALKLVESFSAMDAQELIECYRRVSARFRDCFPASFGVPREVQPGGGRLQDVSVYK